jgi:hypothetical protein
MLSRRTLLLSCASVLTLAGCSGSRGDRQAVAGGVKLAGEPLGEGRVLFFPLDGQDTQGGAAVVNGEYRIARKHGLKPGQYLVRVTAGDGRTAANGEPGAPGGSANVVSVDLVPEDWNVRSTRQVEVTSKGLNQFDFDIPNVNPQARRR